MTVPGGLFGGHIGGRADDLPLGGHYDFGLLTQGQSEIDNHRPAHIRRSARRRVGRTELHHDVPGLNVAMNQA